MSKLLRLLEVFENPPKKNFVNRKPYNVEYFKFLLVTIMLILHQKIPSDLFGSNF